MRPIQNAHILNNYRKKDTILMRRFSLTNCDKIKILPFVMQALLILKNLKKVKSFHEVT